MSGFEIWGAIAGVIGTLEAIAATRHRRQTTFLNGHPSLEAASFRKYQIRAELESLALNRDIYERHIEAKLRGDDRENITNIWQNLGEVVQRSKTVTERLLAGVRRNRLVKQEIEECVTELDSNATTLNTWVGYLNVALQLAAGSLRTQDISTPPSSPQTSVPPVTFIDDARLKLLIEEGNLDKVQRLLSSSPEDPKVICLHAVIGTVDVGEDAPKICKILDLLLEYNVDPCVPDSGERLFTPLHYAADTRNFGAVKALLEQDKSLINATDTHGKTPLWNVGSIKRRGRPQLLAQQLRLPRPNVSHSTPSMSKIEEPLPGDDNHMEQEYACGELGNIAAGLKYLKTKDGTTGNQKKIDSSPST
ncbi:MAG: hypothetical protein Q9209_002431 [Squamulea sp. 1 TL-2023]